jgi:hypothetical protein
MCTVHILKQKKYSVKIYFIKSFSEVLRSLLSKNNTSIVRNIPPTY